MDETHYQLMRAGVRQLQAQADTQHGNELQTTATQLIELPVNQRASYRWVAAPGGELVVPATNVAGLGFRAKAPAYASTALVTIMLWE